MVSRWFCRLGGSLVDMAEMVSAPMTAQMGACQHDDHAHSSILARQVAGSGRLEADNAQPPPAGARASRPRQ